MIRKQVYIEAHQDQMLKRRASQRGITEAEIIREALDSAESGSAVRRRRVDVVAARKALAFMRSLGAASRKSSRTQGWTRESLYEDRISRWAKS